MDYKTENDEKVKELIHAISWIKKLQEAVMKYRRCRKKTLK